MEFRNGTKIPGDALPKLVKKLVADKYDFYDAISAVETSGKSNEVFKRLNRFRSSMVKQETTDVIKNSKGEKKTKIHYEIKKISEILKHHKKP